MSEEFDESEIVFSENCFPIRRREDNNENEMSNHHLLADVVTMVSPEEERCCLVVEKEEEESKIVFEKEKNQKRNFHLSRRKRYPSSYLPVKKRYREYFHNHNGESFGHSSVYNYNKLETVNTRNPAGCKDERNTKTKDPPSPTKLCSSSSSVNSRSNTEQVLLLGVSISSLSLDLKNSPRNPSSDQLVMLDEEQRKQQYGKKVLHMGKIISDNLSKRRSNRQQDLDNQNEASSTRNVRSCFNTDPTNPTKVDSSSSSCTSGKRHNVEQKKSKSGSKKPKIAPNPSVERKVPEWVFQEMGNINNDAENPKAIFETSLSVSDVSPTQSRLLFPFKALINPEFLTPDEERATIVGVRTILVSERSQKWNLRFKKWLKKNKCGKQTFYYVLNSGWNNVVKDNNLKANDKIRLWCFRSPSGVLSFALELLV